MTRARTVSEFHYYCVFIDATAFSSEARLHAELRFKPGIPSNYSHSLLRAGQPRQFLTKVKHHQKCGNQKRNVEGCYVPCTHGMAHEEPERNQQGQRSGDGSQGSSLDGEDISPGLAKELPFLLSSKMSTRRTTNEKGHAASP